VYGEGRGDQQCEHAAAEQVGWQGIHVSGGGIDHGSSGVLWAGLVV
jgi:hypothetical protein